MSEIDKSIIDNEDAAPVKLDISTAPQFSAYDRERAAVLDGEGFPIEDEDDVASSAAKPAAAPEVVATQVDEPVAPQPDEQERSQAEAFVPTYIAAAAPENADARIKELLTEKRAARKMLFDGDTGMSVEQFDAIEERVDGEIESIKNAQTEARLFAKQNEQAQEAYANNDWKRQQLSAFVRFKGEGYDYDTDHGKLAVFNGFMKTLAAQAIAANSNRDARWFFDETHKMTKAYFASTAPQSAPAASAKARGFDRSTLPPTLAGAPVAAVGSIEGSKFAHLEKMTYAQRERAVARMTKDEYNEYAFGDE